MAALPEASQAVEQLRSMFPDLDAEIVQTVFESSGNNFEASLNALLEMGDANAKPTHGDPESDATPRSATVPEVSNLHFTSTSQAQLEQDEVFARALQNEMFMAELNRNEEFRRSISGTSPRY